MPNDPVEADDEDELSEREDLDDADVDENDDPPLIACPYCGEQISEDAEICPHCRSYVSAEDTPRRRWSLWYWIGLMLALLIALLIWRLT